MKDLKILLGTLALFGASCITFANNSTKSADVKVTNSQSANQTQKVTIQIDVKPVTQDVDASGLIDSKIQAYFKKLGIHEGENNGRYFEYAVVGGLNVNDVNFYRKKIMSYEKAYMEALAKIANFEGEKITAETYRTLFSDNSGGIGAEENPKFSNWEVLKNKIMALGEAAIDKVLEKLGVDPSKYGQLKIDKKRQLALDAIKKRIVRKSLAELSGTVPVFTVDGNDKKGDYAVGVVVMYSPALKQLAYDIAHGLQPAIKHPGKPLEKYLPKTPQGWLAAWGPRVVVDEKGNPAIIAYGQWAVPLDTRNSMLLNIRLEAAKRQAELLAHSYIAGFVNSHVTVEEMSTTGSAQGLDLAQYPSGDSELIPKDLITDIFKRKISQKVKAKLQGISNIATKQFDVNINGKRYRVYVVAAAWTYKGYQTAEKIKNWKPSRHNQLQQNNQPTEYQQNVNEGPATTDIYDW